MNERAKLIAKIQKLMALAERAGTEAEAANAAAKVSKLMLQHAIEEAELEQDAKRKSEKPVEERWHIVGQQYGSWIYKYHLLEAVGEANSVKVLFWSVGRRKTGQVSMYGTPTDIEVTKMIFTMLEMQMVSDMQKQKRFSRESWAEFRNGFYQGFWIRIAARLRETKQEFIDDTPGAALVLVSKLEQAESIMPENVKKLKNTVRTGIEGYVAGSKSGARADLGGKRFEKAKKAIG